MHKRAIFKMFLATILLLALVGCNADYTTETGLSMPENQITETVTFMPIVVNEMPMEVMFVRASDGTIRVALNTCENCHASGRGYYVQDGDVVICQHCNMSFDIDYIGLNSGGCQPIPVEYSFEGSYVIITHDTLSENYHWFANFRN